MDIFAERHAKDRARSEREVREAADKQAGVDAKLRITASAKASEAAARPDPRYPWPPKFYEPGGR